ncbi:MAG: ATP-binding cassette domain-containing protein [Lachnospiraceae bacterium]|nr:ATP-binding cassette domain-containing protein [Lachnospiraceae bacterium]
MNEILKVKDLNVSFKDSQGLLFSHTVTKHVLKGVSFEIKEGQILGLVGESGSGKSTIAKAVLGLVPYEGEVIMDNAAPSMVFQDPAGSLNPAKRIGWLLDEALYLRGEKDPDERSNKVLEMINLVGLKEEHLKRYPKELSGGQRQRVCIGRALMSQPRLLIADEPVSALDVTIQAQILELLRDLQKKLDLSILFISHDLRVVYNFCDRLIILKDGVIVEEGDPKVVYRTPKDQYTKVLLSSI